MPSSSQSWSPSVPVFLAKELGRGEQGVLVAVRGVFISDAEARWAARFFACDSLITMGDPTGYPQLGEVGIVPATARAERIGEG